MGKKKTSLITYWFIDYLIDNFIQIILTKYCGVSILTASLITMAIL